MDEKILTFCKRKRNRYKNFDYCSNGAYFVTICSHQKRHIFGEVVNNRVLLTELGQIVIDQIEALQDYNNIEILSYIVMPNHLHIMFIIQNDDQAGQKSLSDVIRILKSKAYNAYRKILKNRDNESVVIDIWQRSYWDHIVRKEEDLVKIDEYIQRNPEFWSEEIENPNTDYPLNIV